MTENEIKQEAQSIFNNLTEAQKNHIQNKFNDMKYCERKGDYSIARVLGGNDIYTISAFLTEGYDKDVRSAFDDILYEYNIDRYNKEQKATDDMLLGK